MLDQSKYRHRIAENFDKFYSLENTSTTQIVKTIQDDNLHILVDLSGYTQGFNQTLFNRVNGPLVVNYLGYPGTTGHPQYDYIIADPIVIPLGQEHHYSETVLRLDCSYQPNSPSREVSEVSFEKTGLPSGTFVFCNFNTRQKLNRETLLAWQTILQNCPDSVLWLLDPGEEMRLEILAVLGRIKNRVFFAESMEISEHLGRSGTPISSWIAFHMVLIRQRVTQCLEVCLCSLEQAKSFQSRVAHSIVHYAGLTDMWAGSWDDFIERGVNFYQTFNEADSIRLRDTLLDRERTDIRTIFNGRPHKSSGCINKF